jgi:hypothetical protein
VRKADFFRSLIEKYCGFSVECRPHATPRSFEVEEEPVSVANVIGSFFDTLGQVRFFLSLLIKMVLGFIPIHPRKMTPFMRTSA